VQKAAPFASAYSEQEVNVNGIQRNRKTWTERRYRPFRPAVDRGAETWQHGQRDREAAVPEAEEG
jgi:hypothetical protein